MHIKSKEVLEKLIELKGNRCSSCGKVLLDDEHQVSRIQYANPFALSETNDLNNLQLLCPTCHCRIDRMRPIQAYEFEKFICEIISKNKNFRNTESLHRSKDFLGDIITERQVGTEWEKLIIEVKYFAALSSHIYASLEHLARKNKGEKTVLVCPSKLTKKAYSILEQHNIEVWDREYLETYFVNEIKQISHPVFTQQLLNIPITTREESLISELKNCKHGKADWFKYQKLIGEILTYLFCPPLSAALSEKTDEPKANRRDFIFPNYSDGGFWGYMRTKYCADYIVVDAKNFSTTINKKEVLQIAHYLKEYGAGLFGIIVTRKGESKKLYYTLREVWITERKLIIILNDDDIEQMLLEKKFNRSSDEIIKQKILDFRISL